MRGPIRIAPPITALIWRSLAVAALTLALGGCGASSAGQITTQPTATAVAPPLSGMKVPYLTGVSMVSTDEGWAVGYGGLAGGAAFALHDQRGVWTKQPLTIQTTDAEMTFSPLGVQMISATDGWIYGSVGSNVTLPSQAAMLHLAGGSWQEEALPTGLSAIRAISFVSADTGWALAYPADLTSNDTVILKYAGGQWTIQKRLIGMRLTTLSMATPIDGMAIGDHGLYRYKAGAWTPTALPASIPTSRFVGVAMISENEAWALAFYTEETSCQECGSGFETVLAHYVNGAWTKVADAQTLRLELQHTFDSDIQLLPNALRATADGQVWITYGALAHYAGGQRMEAFETGCPSDFWGASPVPGADEAWAIGSNGQLFHYAAGEVTRYETGAPCI
ncbi:MAG TPA: hypothetical protein VHR15_04950 [Ktedonobacterales bacterium]|jgi:hypothetical protein|nr:hypothetical protein [Ktedonobacterales bacterium]